MTKRLRIVFVALVQRTPALSVLLLAHNIFFSYVFLIAHHAYTWLFYQTKAHMCVGEGEQKTCVHEKKRLSYIYILKQTISVVLCIFHLEKLKYESMVTYCMKKNVDVHIYIHAILKSVHIFFKSVDIFLQYTIKNALMNFFKIHF